MDRNTANQPVYVVAAGTQYHTVQDHAKAKLAYDVSPTVRASYVLGWWQNTSTNQPTAYLRNPSVLTGADLPVTDESLTHFMHGFSLQSHTQGTFDWALAASLYDYARDLKRQNAAGNVPPGALAGGPGTVADGGGTGWHTLAARGTWRPEGTAGAHIADFGVQQDTYVLKYRTSAIAGNYLANAPGALVSDVGGRTQLASLWAQDAWRFAPAWKAVLGLRGEQWTASRGVTRIPGAAPAVDAAWPERREFHASPKAALSWQWQADTVLKAALGRAVRFPTVGELYGATSTVNARYVNDPNLRPEKSWTGELTAEKDLGNGLLRLTLFAENTRDALYAQTLFDTVANLNVSRVQNVGRIETRGLEVAYNASDVVWKGFDLQASATYADSTIKENAGFVTVPGDTAGKRQPNIPRLRTALLASYRWSERFSTSVGARSSSPQFRTLNNADINGFTYMGVSRFFVVDLRAQWKIDKTFTAAFGIDNLNNDKYWNFHPYPQRSYSAELRFDL
jgi:iron complex outermembrane receptor protein